MNADTRWTIEFAEIHENQLQTEADVHVCRDVRSLSRILLLLDYCYYCCSTSEILLSSLEVDRFLVRGEKKIWYFNSVSTLFSLWDVFVASSLTLAAWWVPVSFSDAASVKFVDAGDVIGAHGPGPSEVEVGVARGDNGWLSVFAEGVSLKRNQTQHYWFCLSSLALLLFTHTFTASVLIIVLQGGCCLCMKIIWSDSRNK